MTVVNPLTRCSIVNYRYSGISLVEMFGLKLLHIFASLENNENISPNI